MTFAAVGIIGINAFLGKESEWPQAKPQTKGLNLDSLRVFSNELAIGQFGYVDALLIIKDNSIVFKNEYKHDYRDIHGQNAIGKSPLANPGGSPMYNYFNSTWHPFYSKDLHTWQSVTKTITSIVIGVAMSRKEFPDLNTPILKFFDAKQIKNVDPRKRKITIKHLLNMTSGFEWHEMDVGYNDARSSGILMEQSKDWVKFTVDQPMADNPGTKFNYNGGNTQILAYIFEQSTKRSIEDYANQFLFKPLGISKYYWKQTPSGLADVEGGLYMEVTNVAKLFSLYLSEGVWNGTRVIAKDWINDSVRSGFKINDQVAYGYQWWLYSIEGLPDTWAAVGFGDQYVILVPKHDLIVIVTGWNILEGAKSLTYQKLLQKIIGSVI